MGVVSLAIALGKSLKSFVWKSTDEILIDGRKNIDEYDRLTDSLIKNGTFDVICPRCNASAHPVRRKKEKLNHFRCRKNHAHVFKGPPHGF